MIARAIAFIITFYILITVFQWGFKSKVDWLNNIGIALLLFFIHIFIDRVCQTFKSEK